MHGGLCCSVVSKGVSMHAALCCREILKGYWRDWGGSNAANSTLLRHPNPFATPGMALTGDLAEPQLHTDVHLDAD